MKRIVAFTFANGTQLRVAVDPHKAGSRDGNPCIVDKPFDEMVHEAKQLIWHQKHESVDNEAHRGGLVKIELEGYIYV